MKSNLPRIRPSSLPNPTIQKNLVHPQAHPAQTYPQIPLGASHTASPISDRKYICTQYQPDGREHYSCNTKEQQMSLLRL